MSKSEDNSQKQEQLSILEDSKIRISKDDVGAKPDKMTKKDLIAVTLSICAIFIASGTAYFNIIRTEENVSVIMSHDVYARRAKNNDLYINPNEEGEIVFINSGNRPVVIRSVVMSYTRSKPNTKPNCRADPVVHFETNFQPAVLKINEITITKIKISRNAKFTSNDLQAKLDENGNFIFPSEFSKIDELNDNIDVCMYVRLTLPSTAYEGAEVPVFRYTIGQGYFSFDPVEHEKLFNKPAILVKRLGTLFER